MKDCFGVKAEDLKYKKLYLFDMDGTIYREKTLFDGAKTLCSHIENNDGYFIFITNNSSKSVTDYIKKVKSLGIEVGKDNFFTSTQATILLLQEKYPNVKVYCQGTKSLVKELEDNGIYVTEDAEPDVGLVLVGFDTELTSDKLRKTCMLLGRDIPFYATNCDLRCPVSFGYIPDCGSICGMLKNSTGREPIYIGKPEPTMVNYAMKKFNVSKEETVVVGDRLYTDIATGLNAGVTSICVLTGEATINDIKNGIIKPTFTFNSVKDIYEAIL